MRILLDTCTFLWWMTSPSEVPRAALDVLRAPENDVLLSVVTGWEIAIKRKLGRLELPGRTSAFLADAVERHDIGTLAVTMAHAVGAGELPLHHKDPFDRMLVAQARLEELVIATPDPAFRKYGVKTLWRRRPAGISGRGPARP
jgi:PIN domain nuclease of toxin-antitoxin system